jgi:hypothetical protein
MMHKNQLVLLLLLLTVTLSIRFGSRKKDTPPNLVKKDNAAGKEKS